jgi:hypothetical protein
MKSELNELQELVDQYNLKYGSGTGDDVAGGLNASRILMNKWRRRFIRHRNYTHFGRF